MAAVLGGLVLPAIPAFFVVWGSYTALSDVVVGETDGSRTVFLVAAALMSAPVFVLVAPLTAGLLAIAMAALVHVARAYGWAGPGSMVALSWLIGLPFAHVFFNGDLTTEAPEMIPFLAATLAIQALCGWAVLNFRFGRKRAFEPTN